MPVGDQRFWYQGAFERVMALEELSPCGPAAQADWHAGYTATGW